MTIIEITPDMTINIDSISAIMRGEMNRAVVIFGSKEIQTDIRNR